jgi:hypothetical protein
MGMKNSNYKVQLIFSIVMTVLVISLLTVIRFVFNGIDTASYIFIDIALLIWPVAVFISYRQLKNADHDKRDGKAPVKLSIIGWLLISLALLVYNYITEGAISWAYYPIAGVTLWPVGMLIYNILTVKINSN